MDVSGPDFIITVNDCGHRQIRLVINRIYSGLFAQINSINLLFIFLISLLSDIVYAEQESLFDLNLEDLLRVQVVTAASGFEQNLEKAPASVTVVHAEQWQAAGAKTLYEAISRVPGLHLTLAQTGTSLAIPIIRGLSGTFGQQVLLLVDGIPYRSVREGGVPWGAYIPLNGFKQIEVIRGSGSAIYGADAVGGIINLVSYQAGENPTAVSIAAGSFKYRSFEASAGTSIGEHKFNFTWASEKEDDDPERIVEFDAQSFLDTQFGTSASLAPGAYSSRYKAHNFRGMWAWGDVSASYSDLYAKDVGLGSGVAQALDPEGSGKIRTQMAQLDFDLSRFVPGKIEVRTTWQKIYAEVNSTLFPAGAVVPLDDTGNLVSQGSPDTTPTLVLFSDGVKGKPITTNHVLATQLNHVFNLSHKHKLRWAIGAEHYDNHTEEYKNFGHGQWQGETEIDGTLVDVTNTEFAYLKNIDRDLVYAALQDQWQINEYVIATLGLRFDHYSDFGSTTNPRLGLLWRATKNVTFKLFSGSAFRAPSFVDLYARNNPAGQGNPDLEPETVNLVDMGLSANYVLFDSLQFETSLYRYSANNLIAFGSSTAGEPALANNSGRIKLRGIEQQINWRTGEALSVDFNISLIDPHEANNFDTSAIPRLLANLSLYYRFEKINVFLGGHYVAQRERTEGDLRENIKPYLWATARAEMQWNTWRAGISVDNLLDKDAFEPANMISLPNDNPLPGRSIRADLKYRF